MADLDVDALCAELDDILDKPTPASSRGGYPSHAQTKSVAKLASIQLSSNSLRAKLLLIQLCGLIVGLQTLRAQFPFLLCCQTVLDHHVTTCRRPLIYLKHELSLLLHHRFHRFELELGRPRRLGRGFTDTATDSCCDATDQSIERSICCHFGASANCRSFSYCLRHRVSQHRLLLGR